MYTLVNLTNFRNQFHDVIPGSSINEVYKDSTEHYKYILESASNLRSQALASLAGEQTGTQYVAYNTLAFPRTEIIETPATTQSSQTTYDGKSLTLATVPSMGYSVINAKTVTKKLLIYQVSHKHKEKTVGASEANGTIILENEFVKATISKNGRLVSYYDKRADRECIDSGKLGNQFALYDDVPMYWDAWYSFNRFEDILLTLGTLMFTTWKNDKILLKALPQFLKKDLCELL